MQARLALCALALTLVAPLSAQQPPLAPGQRVRVTAPSAGLDKANGTVWTLSAHDITLELERYSGHGARIDTFRRTVPLDSVLSLEVRRGGHGHAGTGAVIGFAVGALSGMIAVSATNQGLLQFSPGLGLLAGIPGALVGALVGGSARSDNWEEIHLDRHDTGLAPPPARRLVLGAAFRF